jgi:hypothetical protein
LDPHDTSDGRSSEREERIAPNEIDLIKYRSSKTTVQFGLINSEHFEGKIVWYDGLAIKIIRADKSEVTILRRALAWYKTRS